MKLGKVIFETGKLGHLEPHQQWYFAYHPEETKFGVMDSILVGQIPISTLTYLDDQTPSHLRRFIKTFKATSGETKSRLRKAQRNDVQATHKPPRGPNQIGAVVLEGNGTLLCNTSSMQLVRLRDGAIKVLELSAGKTYRWKVGDTYLLTEPKLTQQLPPEELLTLLQKGKTKEIPDKLRSRTDSVTPYSLLAFSIKKPPPLFLEPAFLVSLLALLMVLLFALLLAPHLPAPHGR